MMNRDSIFEDIANERDDQDISWGTIPRGQSFPIMVAILTEEVGEVAKAILQGSSMDSLRRELVQVAAVAVFFIEEVDHLTK